MGSDCVRAGRLDEESGLYSKSQWEASEDFGPKRQRYSPKQDGQRPRYSTSLVIRGMQINSTMRYQVIHAPMARIKKIDNNKC